MLEVVLLACLLASDDLTQRAEVSLEIYCDPEIEYDYLTLFARQTSYEPDIMQRLEKVASPVDRALAGKSGYLLVGTDFRLVK